VARIQTVGQGAYGSVRLRTEAGSLFLFRPEYAPSELESGASAPSSGDELPDQVLFDVDSTVQAELRALSLLARAEQNRSGLERKLAAKACTKDAIRKALDYLETEGFLDDRRYAQAWLRGRIGRGVVGPLKLRAGLAAKGLDSRAIRAAMETTFSGEERRKTLIRVIEALEMKDFRDKPLHALRSYLKSLGYGTMEIDDVLDEMNA